MSGIPLPCYLRGFRMSGIPLPCYLRCFQAPSCPSPCYLRCFQASVTMLFAVFSSAQMSVTMLFAVFSCAQMSVTMLFAVFSSAQMSVTMLIAVFSCAQMSVTMLFAVFSDAQGVRCVLRLYYKQSTATEAPRVRGVLGVLRLCYKSRLSSHGSSACPWRTTFVLQKSTFQPRKLRVSAAYYVCTTKVDFPATEAPGVPGVLHLYYKSRLSCHGSSGCPRRTTSVLQNSTFQPRKLRVSVLQKSTLAPRPRRNPQRGYVRMSKNAKTRGFWHRANAATRRGVTFVCEKRQKHDGFGTAPTPKPAEGCLRPRKKVPKTTVLAPRPGDHPQRVVRGHKET